MSIDWQAEIERMKPYLHEQALKIIKAICADVRSGILPPHKAMATITTIVNSIPGLKTEGHET